MEKFSHQQYSFSNDDSTTQVLKDKEFRGSKILRTEEIQMMDTVEIKKMIEGDNVQLNERLDRLYFKIWILMLLFLFYSCLVPLNIKLSQAHIITNIEKMRLVPYWHEGKFESLTDIGSNILLFIPFGFLMLSFWHKKTRIIGLLFAIIAGMALSAFLEIMQLFVTIRTTSITDVCNNTIGTFIGAMIYLCFRKQFAKFIFLMFIKEIHSNVLQIYSHGILVCILLLGLAPYHFNLDLGAIRGNIKFILRHIEIFPRWEYMRECINNLFLFTLSGFFMTLSYYKKKNWLLYITYILFANFFLVFLIEISRIFLLVNSIAIPKICFACFGTLNGLLWGLLYLKSSNLVKNTKYFFYLIFWLFLIFNYLYPFQLDPNPEFPKTSSMIPFSLYFFNIDPQRSPVNFGNNIADMITQIILFLPIGFGFSSFKKKYIQMFFIGFFVCFNLEFCQIFIKSRVFDITDAMVAGFGCVVGHSLKWRFENLLKQASFDIDSNLDSNNLSTTTVISDGEVKTVIILPENIEMRETSILPKPVIEPKYTKE